MLPPDMRYIQRPLDATKRDVRWTKYELIGYTTILDLSI